MERVVGDAANDGLEQVMISLDLWRNEAGEVRRVCDSLGRAEGWQRRKRESLVEMPSLLPKLLRLSTLPQMDSLVGYRV